MSGSKSRAAHASTWGCALALAALWGCSDSQQAVAVADSAAEAATDGGAAQPDVSAAADATDVNVNADANADSNSDAFAKDDAASSTSATDASPMDANEASSLCASMAFAGCATFADLTGDASDRTIAFENYQYTPKCVQMRSGQSVTFAGDFVVHPLVQACGPEDVLERRLPLNVSPGTSTRYAFTLMTPGVYGYYCLDHGNPQGDVMSGAIQVIP